MWHRDMKWANAIGRMAAIDLEHRVVPNQLVINVVSVKHYEIERGKTRCACTPSADTPPQCWSPGLGWAQVKHLVSPVFHILFSSNLQKLWPMKGIKRHEGTSLAVQWIRLHLFTFQCRKCRFNPWLGWDPICLVAKKPKHKTQTVLQQIQ